MSWPHRIRWRWVVLGGFLWLTLLSSSSLEDGHAGMARFGSTAAVALLVLALLVAVLKLFSRLVIAVIRQGTKLWQRHPAARARTSHSPAPRRPR